MHKQKDKGQERVFNELSRHGDKYGHYPSRWFSLYKKACGIEAEPRMKTFHSFRHTFYSNLAHQRILPSLIDPLTGHASEGSEGVIRYTKAFPVKVLLEEAIMKLDYEGLDFSHLKGAKTSA